MNIPEPSDAETSVHGTVAAGFEDVETEFKNNFITRGELGGACAVYLKGEKVVDLWGGFQDAQTRAPWREDTVVVVFSTTKGMAAAAMAVAHAKGLFDLEQPVARYWPEFAKNGKGQITIRQLFAHEAGLPICDEPLTLEKLADLEWLATALAQQKPVWKAGACHGYHGLNLGWYQSALLRRVDPQRRPLSQFFQEEIAKPLGIDFYIGLPATVSETRVAALKSFRPWELLLHLDTMPVGLVLGVMCPWSLTHRALMNPRTRSPGDINLPAYRTVEFPAAGGWGTARALASVYSELASGGRELSLRPETFAALTAPAPGSRDVVLKIETAFAMGFMKPCSFFRFGNSGSSFGHAGAGGSFAFADPDLELGYGYVTNKMGFHFCDDPREKSVRDAVYRCVAKFSKSRYSSSVEVNSRPTSFPSKTPPGPRVPAGSVVDPTPPA